MESYALLYRDNELRPNYEVYRGAELMSADDDSLHTNKLRPAKSAHFKLEEDKISYKENIIVDLLSFVVKL